MEFNVLYDNKYFNSQLEKFNNRKNNHWAPRIQKNFEMIDGLGLKKGKVLDLGCSIGTYAFEFASRGFEVIGIDLSENAISVAKKLASDNDKNIKYVIGDISDRSKFNEGEFDIIYAGDIIEHLQDGLLNKTISNCCYWLKPGGYFIFHTVPTKYSYLFHNKYFWLALVPYAVLPDGIFKYVVKFYYWKLNIMFKIFTGRSLRDREKESVHCNLQTKEGLSRTLEANGFKLKNIELITTEDRFKKWYKMIFFRNKEYFKKDIFGIAIK